jgi:hypothetical protein
MMQPYGCIGVALSYYATWRLHTLEDQIKQIEIKAPVSRVWRALTDHREFGEWFRVKLVDPSSKARCPDISVSGIRTLPWEAVVRDIQPENCSHLPGTPRG